MSKDMTHGNPQKILFYFALPMVLGNLFQQLYNVVDSIIVGNFIGSKALAAVGASYPITFLFIAVATGLSIGSSVVISQLFGAKDFIKMKSAIYTSLISLISVSIFLTIIGFLICTPLLRLLQTPDDILNDASLYLRIYILGLFPLFLYNAVNAILNGLGDSKTPLYFLIFSSILNVILDLLFVVVFKYRISGAAFATLISQLSSAVLSLMFLMKRLKRLNLNGKSEIFNSNLIIKISNIAVPTMIQQSIVSFGLLFVQKLVNSYGSDIVSGYTAATKIDSMAVLPIVNLSNAVSTFTAQNIGAGLFDRVKKGYNASLTLIAGFCILITSVLFIFGSQLMSLFVDTNSNTAVIQVGSDYLRVVSLGYILKGISGASNGVLKGSGDMGFFMFSTLSNFTLRVVSAYSLAYILGEKAIWYSIPIGWAVELIISMYRYRSGKWQNKRVKS